MGDVSDFMYGSYKFDKWWVWLANRKAGWEYVFETPLVQKFFFCLRILNEKKKSLEVSCSKQKLFVNHFQHWE